MSLVPYQNFPDSSPKKVKRHTRQPKMGSNLPKTKKNQSPPRKSYTTHVSNTTGKTYYVTSTGESVWERPLTEPSESKVPESEPSEKEPKPEVRGNLPEGIEIRYSRTTKEPYYYDTRTGDTMWDLPAPQNFVPGSIPHLLERAEDRVINSFGILTCREIKYLLDTSELSEEEQVKFIEDNAKDTSILRKFIKASNFNQDQLSVMSEMAPKAIDRIKMVVLNLVRENTEPPSTDDPDAEPECAILREKVMKFYKKGNGITKRMWASFIEKANAFVSKWSSLTYDSFISLYNSLPSAKQLLYVVQWFVSKGISITLWISSNPRIAYYTLCAFKYAKEYGCQIIGEACKMLEYDPREHQFIKYLQANYPQTLDINEKQKLSSKLLEFLQPRIQSTAIKGIASIISSACTYTSKLVNDNGKVAYTSMAALFVTNPVLAVGGSLAYAAVQITFTATAKTIEEEAKATAEELTYWNDARLAYSKLIDLCDPLPCILEVLKISDAAQNDKRDRFVKTWKAVATKYLTSRTTVVNVPAIVIKFKKIFNALDQDNEYYNQNLTIDSIHDFLDKYSRAKPGVPQYASISNSPRTQEQIEAVRQLANEAYYDDRDMWIQVGIYVWLIQRDLIDDSSTTPFGNLVQLTLPRYIEIEDEVKADIRKGSAAEKMSELDKWRCEFNDLKYTWDQQSSVEDEYYDGEPAGPLITKILSTTLRHDVASHLSKLGEAARNQLKEEVSLILNTDPYVLIASVILHLKTSPLYREEYPFWLNKCFLSMKETTPQYCKNLDAPSYTELVLVYNKFNDSLQANISGNKFKSTVNAAVEDVVSIIKNRCTRHLNAYYAFKTATSERKKRLCIHAKRAVEIPLRVVARMIELDQGRTSSTLVRKMEYVKMMQCILKRVDSPFVSNPNFHPFHKYSGDVKEKLNKKNLMRDSNLTESNFRQSIVNMWMFYKEVVYYGYSKSYAAGQSASYKKEFTNAVNLRLAYEEQSNEILVTKSYIDAIKKSIIEESNRSQDFMKLLNDMKSEKETIMKKLVENQPRLFEEANAAIKRVYQMDSQPKYYKSPSWYSSPKYTPTVLDSPQLWADDVTGGSDGRREQNNQHKTDIIATVKQEEDNLDKKWKMDMRSSIDLFAARAKSFNAIDEFTNGYEPKVRFTSCFISDTKHESFSMFSSVPFSGGVKDPLLYYYNPSIFDIQKSQVYDRAERQFNDLKAARNKAAVYVKENDYTYQLFSDNNNPTVYQIFEDLNLPDPSIPFSQWSRN